MLKATCYSSCRDKGTSDQETDSGSSSIEYLHQSDCNKLQLQVEVVLML